jgi:hypothetical protein
MALYAELHHERYDGNGYYSAAAHILGRGARADRGRQLRAMIA